MALIQPSINLHTKCYLMKGRRTPSDHDGIEAGGMLPVRVRVCFSSRWGGWLAAAAAEIVGH